MRGGVVMTDEVTRSTESEDNAGFSRRNALKAGAAVGVGAVAWSGATITSLGGTPAYAVACSQSIQIDFTAGCRNIDLGNDNGCGSNHAAFGYHTLVGVYPDGYSLTNNVPSGGGTCCTANFTPVLHFPAGITCQVVLHFGDTANCTRPENAVPPDVVFTSAVGATSLDITLGCHTFNPQTQYTLVATCATTGSQGCFQ